MLPVLVRSPLPDWLGRLSSADDELPIQEILRGSVFYPASHLDGRPVQYLGGYSHSFVLVDCNVTQDDLHNNLDTFRGYRVIHSRMVEKQELSFRPFQRIRPSRNDGDPAYLHVREGFIPFAVWAIYERQAAFDEAHGPERFSLLFVGGEGAATFQELYYSNKCTPSVIALIRSDGFTGNWTNFCEPEMLLARSVMRNPSGNPEYIFGCDTPGHHWPWYSKKVATVISHLDYSQVRYQRLYLWIRGR